MIENNFSSGNNNSQKDRKIPMFLVETIPPLAMTVIVIAWFFWLVLLKLGQGIQVPDWFEIFGAVLLFAGVMQRLWEMIIPARIPTWISVKAPETEEQSEKEAKSHVKPEDTKMGKIAGPFISAKSTPTILMGALLLLLSIALSMLLKYFS